MLPLKKLSLRLAFLVAGLSTTATGCALMVAAGLGSDPYNVMAQGLALRTGVQVGTMNSAIQILILLAVLPRRRSCIGVGTVFAAVLLGSVINLWTPVFAPLLAAPLPLRTLCALLAPIPVGIGIALVQAADLGVCSNDAAPLLLHRSHPRLQYRSVRIAYDAAEFVLGVLLGGTIGIGTVFSLLLTGPVIQATLSMLSRISRGSPLHRASSPV